MSGDLRFLTPQLLVDLVGLQAVQHSPRPIVQQILCAADLALRDVVDVGALREALVDQSVGVLVGTTLPRAVGMREVDVEKLIRMYAPRARAAGVRPSSYLGRGSSSVASPAADA